MTTSPLKIIAGYAQIDQSDSALLRQQRAHYHTRLAAIDQLNITPTLLTIDPLATDWHSEQQANHFRSGCAPLMALKQAQRLIEQGHDAVIISGDDPVKSGYSREERHQLMSVYADDYSIAQLYNDLAYEFIDYNQSNEQQFSALADALFSNHRRSHKIAEQEGRAHFPAPGAQWFAHVTQLFRGVDCANPLVDFSGRLLLCSEALSKKINCSDDSVVNVAGIGLGLLDIDEVKKLPLIARYEHLTQAYQAACHQANIDLNPLITENKVLMEIYTCYPVVPLAFLISSGLVSSLDKVPAFLDNHLLTITGGMNLARAPWNNPALNGLIEMYHQLISTSHQFGLVHGNGGIGYRQGIAILESARH